MKAAINSLVLAAVDVLNRVIKNILQFLRKTNIIGTEFQLLAGDDQGSTCDLSGQMTHNERFLRFLSSVRSWLLVEY